MWVGKEKMDLAAGCVRVGLLSNHFIFSSFSLEDGTLYSVMLEDV